MPPVGAAIATWVGTLTVAKIATFALQLTASVALGQLAQALAPKSKRQLDLSSRAVMLRSAIEPRRQVYGARVLVSGPMVYAQATGNYKEYLHLVIALAGHELATDPIAYYFNDYIITARQLDGSGNVIEDRFAGIARLEFMHGEAAQTANATLVGASGGLWTDAHRLRGVAYLYARLLRDDRKYQTGVPQIRALVVGKHCYDLRSATTHATENPALILYDYLTTMCNVDASEIDSASFQAAANLCEERVAVEAYETAATPYPAYDYFLLADAGNRISTGDKVWVASTGSVPGGLAASTDYYASRYWRLCKLHPTYADAVANTNAIDITSAGSGAITLIHKDQVRYACNGVFHAEQDRVEIVDQILSSMLGTLVVAGGKMFLYGAAWTSPTLTIDESWLRSDALQITPTLTRSSLYNAVRGTYGDANLLFEQTDYPIVADASYQTQDGGEQIVRDYNLACTSNAITAQRLARIVLERSRRQEQISLPLNLKGLQLACWDTVQLSLSSLAIAGDTYRVTRWSLAFDSNGALGVNVDLQAEDSTVYSWASSDPSVVNPPPEPVLPDRDVPAPGSPNVTEELYETIGSAGVRARAIFTWEAAASGISQSSAYELQYRLSGASTWTTLPAVRDTRAVVDDLAPGGYDLRLRTVAGGGTASEWVLGSASIMGLSAPPSAPSGFSVVPIGGLAQLSWEAHPDLDVRIGGRIYARHSPLTSGASWNEASDLTIAGYPGRDSYATAPLKEGTYFLKAVDSSGTHSTTAASFVVKFADLSSFVTVDSITEDPAFAGTFNALAQETTGIFIAGETAWDDISGNIDDWTLLDSQGGVRATGTYTFASRMDLGSVDTVRLYGHLKVAGFDTGDTIDLRSTSIDDWNDFDGLTIDDSSALLMFRATDDDPNSGSPTWGTWGLLTVNDVTARGFEFRINLYSDNPTHNVLVSQARVVAKQFS